MPIGESLKVFNIYNYIFKNIDMTPCKCIFDNHNYLHYSHMIIKQISCICLFTFTHTTLEKTYKKSEQDTKMWCISKNSPILNLSLISSCSCSKLHRKGGKRCFANQGIVKNYFWSPFQLTKRHWNVCVINHKEPKPFILPFYLKNIDICFNQNQTRGYWYNKTRLSSHSKRCCSKSNMKLHW